MHELHSAVTTVTINLSSNYGYVLLVGVLLALEIIFIGFLVAGKARGQIFTEEFMKEHFGEQHKEATGEEI